MYAPKKILIGSVYPWDSPVLKTGDHHYAELFVKDGHKVFWVSHHVAIPHLFKKQNSIRLKNALKGVREMNGVLYYTPFTLLPYIRILPFNVPWVGKHHLRFAIPSLRSILESHGFRNVDLLLMSEMSLYYLSEVVRYRKFALRIVDDFSGFATTPKSLLDLQKILIQKADHIFLTSPELMKYNISNQKNFWYLPNAVNLQHFSGQFPLPKEYKKIPSPRILFVGGLFEYVDTNLISAAAQLLPSYNFVLIGPTYISIDQIKNKSNIFLLGPIKYQDIPAYMKHADVAIIPFKQEELVQSISPLKLFEYLASGLPVVCSRMKGLETMKPPVYFAANKEEFVAALQEAYRKGKNHAEFLEFAKKNSWVERYRGMTSILFPEVTRFNES